MIANWDKKGKDNEQFLKAYSWDGKKLSPLLDADNRVRNIYSVGFLNPQLVLNDVRTVLMQSPSAAH